MSIPKVSILTKKVFWISFFLMAYACSESWRKIVEVSNNPPEAITRPTGFFGISSQHVFFWHTFSNFSTLEITLPILPAFFFSRETWRLRYATISSIFNNLKIFSRYFCTNSSSDFSSCYSKILESFQRLLKVFFQKKYKVSFLSFLKIFPKNPTLNLTIDLWRIWSHY